MISRHVKLHVAIKNTWLCGMFEAVTTVQFFFSFSSSNTEKKKKIHNPDEKHNYAVCWF